MPRKGNSKKRELKPDPVYGERRLSKFFNIVMRRGKKSTAERVIYQMLDLIKERTQKDNEIKGDALVVFRKALENVKPVLEIKSRRVGGSTYQVPVEVRPERRESLGMRWIVDAARTRSGHTMSEKLADEFMDAYHRRGGAIKKREEVHRMAEANKAFSHYRW